VTMANSPHEAGLPGCGVLDPETVYAEATYMNHSLRTENLISLLFYKAGI
jgi:hypothetical protein